MIAGAAALRSASAASLPPVAFLIGPNAWLRDELCAVWKRLAVEPAWQDMNAETRWAEDTPEAAAADLASTPPFGGARRFVCIRGVEAWRGGARAEDDGGEEGGAESAAPAPRKRRTKASKAEVTPMVRYLGAPDPGTVLVLTSDRWEMKKWEGDALFETAAKAGAVVVCERPEGDLLRAWLDERAKAAGVVLETAAAAELVERVGGDPWTLVREIEKLAAWTGGNRAATEADVATLAAEVAPPDMFGYLDALFVDRRPGRALSLLARLLDEFHPLALHALILGQLRKLAILKGGLARGLNVWQTGVRMPGPALERAALMVRRTPASRYLTLFRALAAAEGSLKRGGDGRAVLESLTLECCR